MKILALDLGTKMGWAHNCGVSGTWDLRIRRDESAGMRLIRLRAKLREIREGEGIDLLVFEAVRHANPRMGGAVVVMAELQGVIKLWCESLNIEYRGMSPTEIKKYATGKGNCNKDAMRTAAKLRWGKVKVARMDDNEIDAKWLLAMVKDELGKE